MPWLSTFTAGFTAVPAIALFSSTSTLSIELFKPFNWLRSSDDEMRELFTGNDGSNGINLFKKYFIVAADVRRVETTKRSSMEPANGARHVPGRSGLACNRTQ